MLPMLYLITFSLTLQKGNNNFFILFYFILTGSGHGLNRINYIIWERGGGRFHLPILGGTTGYDHSHANTGPVLPFQTSSDIRMACLYCYSSLCGHMHHVNGVCIVILATWHHSDTWYHWWDSAIRVGRYVEHWWVIRVEISNYGLIR